MGVGTDPNSVAPLSRASRLNVRSFVAKFAVWLLVSALWVVVCGGMTTMIAITHDGVGQGGVSMVPFDVFFGLFMTAAIWIIGTVAYWTPETNLPEPPA
jgi:hypothetical protein